MTVGGEDGKSGGGATCDARRDTRVAGGGREEDAGHRPKWKARTKGGRRRIVVSGGEAEAGGLIEGQDVVDTVYTKCAWAAARTSCACTRCTRIQYSVIKNVFVPLDNILAAPGIVNDGQT